jgi:hypothetical protein
VRYRLVLFAFALSLLITACGSSPWSSSSTSPKSGSSGSSNSSASSQYSTTLGRKPLPAGVVPSAIALEVCSSKARGQIDQVLGVTASVQDRSWVNHLYTCNYVYTGASFQLSVKELSSWPETYAYYNGLGKEFGNAESLGNLGQGAFRAANGDVVVRKDWKVLLVNIAGLPSQFGNPPTASTDVAYTVADVILACWAGD